jgi:hypothetical protein
MACKKKICLTMSQKRVIWLLSKTCFALISLAHSGSVTVRTTRILLAYLFAGDTSFTFIFSNFCFTTWIYI